MSFVVDSSVWIDYFNGRQSIETETLDRALGREVIVIGDIILAEVLQGFRHDRDYLQAKARLRHFPIVPMLGETMAITAADNYRRLRKQGVTVRKTIDVIIASYCIEQALPLLYSDRDFDPMVAMLGLQPLPKLAP